MFCCFVGLFFLFFVFFPENPDSFPRFEESKFSYKISLIKSSNSGYNNIHAQSWNHRLIE